MANEAYRLTQTGAEVQADLNDIEALGLATEETAGKMSAADKQKLDGLPSSSELDTALAGKVDKVNGKGLSTNDYTDAEKDKVALLSSDSAVVDARPADTLVGQPDSIVLQVKRKSGSTTTITEFDLASYYVQKEQGKGLVSDAEKATWNGKYTKSPDGIPASDLASGVIPDVSNFITKSVDDLVNYYLKSETYTKTEVQNLIAAINQFHYEIYASTSAVTDPASNVLYLIGPTGTGADKYEEYVYDSTKQDPWVKIGDTSIDLSGYVTTTALNTALADYTTTANLTTLLAGKQDKIDSTHKLDYSLIDNTPSIPDAVEANPTVPSGTTPSDLTGLKVGSNYYAVDGGAAKVGNSVPAPETLIRVDYYSESAIPSAKGTVIDGTIKVNFDGFVLEKYAQAEVQGNSSASNPKKNLTFGLFDDDQYSEEFELRIGNMVPHSEFVFKANYGDAAQVRNVGCNKLWEQVIHAHDNPPYRGNEGVYPYDTGALCHVDGFPCVLYFNDTFYGIGWWNIGKKRNNYDMGKNNQNQIQLQAEPRVDLTAPYSSAGWEIRNPATPDEYFEGKVNAWLTDNAKTGDTFKTDFANHHNVRNAIDYFIFVEFIYDEDGLDNNIMLTTWDGSEFWMLPYDLDSSLGLTYNGTATTPYNESVTETTMGGNALTANTRAFWRKFREAFKAELSERYRELKDLGIFTVANINRIVSDAQKRYGKDNFALEAAAWPNIPSLNITSKMQILNWVKNRIAWMDTYYKMADVPVESISIDNGTQAGTNKYRYIATVSPANATDKRVTWSVESGSSYATIDQQGVVTVLEGADADTVVIRATSVADQTIYADKTIEVTYEEPLTYDVDYDKQSLSGTSSDYEEYQNVHLHGDDETQWSMFVLLPTPPVSGGTDRIRTLLNTNNSDSGNWDGISIQADSMDCLTPAINTGASNIYINPGTGQVGQGSPYGNVSYANAVPLVISRNGTDYKYSMDGVTWNVLCSYTSPTASTKTAPLQIGGQLLSGSAQRIPTVSSPVRVAIILGRSEYGFSELFAEYE